MAVFTPREISTTADMFRSVPTNYRGLVTGIMIGQNVSQDQSTLSEMLSLAMALANDNKTA